MTDPLYERVIEESSEGIFVAQDGEILFTNGTLQELTGYTETDLEGIPTTELVAPEYEDRVVTHHSDRIDGSSESIHDEIALETSTGDRVPVDLSISEISNDGDRAVVAYCREKEPQTAAESHQVLEELPQESQTVLHDLQEALFLLDVDADRTVRFQRFTELGEQVTSNSTVEIQGKTPVEVFGEAMGRQLEGKYRECLDRMVPVSYEQKLQLDGERTQWQTKLIPIVVDGRVERVVGFTRDVTARKQRERDLVRYKSIVESMDDVVFVVGKDRQVKYVNPSTANYAGVPAEALEHVGIEESARRMTTSEADAERWLDAFEQALEAGQRDETGLPADDQFPIRVEIELDLPGGTVIADQWISPMYVDGAVSGAFVISRDITERREHEQQLQALTERLELAVDGAGLGIWDWDMTSDEVEFNEQWAEMLGYSLDEIEPHLDAWETRVHPDDIEGVEEALEAHIAGETEFYDTEHRMRTVDGDWKWIRDLGKIADRDGDGNPTRAVGIHIDIDERKSFERTLAEERDMFAQGPAVVFKWKDEEGWPVEYVSDNVESVLGYTPAQLESGEVAFDDVLHDEDTDRVARDVRANSDPGTDRFSHEPYRVVTADGDVRWVLDSTKNVREGDEITHRLGYLVDITTRKEREQELKQFRAAVEQTAHSVYITDTDGRIEYVNPAFETQTGYTAQEAIGETPDLLNSGTHDDELFAVMWETILSGDVWEQEVVNERADGSHYYADQTVAPITDETGDVTAFVAVNRDITERKERERELEQHKEVIDNIPVGIYRVTPGPAGEFVEVNPAMVDMFDASSRAELCEHSVSDIYADPDRRAAFSEAVITDGIARETEPENAEFDGLAELYFETLDDLHEALGSPGSRDYDPTKEVAAKAREDVDNFLAVEERPRFIGEEIVQKDEVDADTDRLYKHSAFLVRQEGMTHEEFVDYWQNNHTPIAREIQGVVKYNTVLPADPEHAEFDGVAELYFEDLSKLYAALGSEGSRDYDPSKGKAKEAREDVNNFLAIDERPRFIGQERLVKDDT